MFRATVFLVSAALFTQCTNRQPTITNRTASDTSTVVGAEKQPIAAPTTEIPFRLDYFETLPDRIGGCGEYLTYDTTSFDKKNYIFLSNLSEYALIKVKGKEIYLTKDTAQSQTVNDKNYTAVYKGQSYTAVLKLQQTKAYDEGCFYTGTLEIKGHAINARFQIHGESGC